MHPDLQLGPFTLHWYGILVATGFLTGIWTASRRGIRQGLSPDKIVDLGMWLALGGVVGARIVFVVSYWKDAFSGQPFWEVFMVWRGGLVFYGGLIGALAAGLAYTRYQKLSYWKLADTMAPSVALGHFFGRLGCLMNGCCYGRACSLPWAIHFPAEHQTGGAGVHPTEIYESLLNLLLYFGLAWLYRRKQFSGQVFALYLLGYAILRSFVELFRGDYPPEQLHGFITPAHQVSLGIFVVGAVIYWRLASARPGENAAKV